MMKYSLRVLATLLCLGLMASSPALAAEMPAQETTLSGEIPLFVPASVPVQPAE